MCRVNCRLAIILSVPLIIGSHNYKQFALKPKGIAGGLLIKLIAYHNDTQSTIHKTLFEQPTLTNLYCIRLYTYAHDPHLANWMIRKAKILITNC